MRFDWLFPFQIESRNSLFHIPPQKAIRAITLSFKHMLQIDFYMHTGKSSFLLHLDHENTLFAKSGIPENILQTYRQTNAFTAFLLTWNSYR